MLRKIAMAEEELFESSESSTPSAEFEKLDLTSSGSAMSSVFGSDKPSPSRSSSPQRKSGSFFHRRSSSHGSVDHRKKKDDRLARWLQGGNVIYKSVGLGLMDLTVGMHLIEFAKEKGVGSHIEGF
jgi:hypothetical protein